MRTTTVVSNQSLFDIAIQESGSVLAVFDWAIKNEVSITGMLTPGQDLENPESGNDSLDIAKYFKGKNRRIATALTAAQQEDLSTPDYGIGEMSIENTFITH